VHEANDAFLRMIGFTAEDVAAGRVRWDDLTPPEFRGASARALDQLRTTGTAQLWEKQILRKDGTRVPVLSGVSVLEYPMCISFVADLTEQKRAQAELSRAQEQLQQAQKMEAVGRLAAGVAHDFNNLLSVVLSYAESIRESMAPGDPRAADAEEIRRAAERGAALTRQLLAFSRRQFLQPHTVDVNAIVTGTEKMLRRLIGEDVTLVVIPASDPAMVRVDPGQMEQVLINLAVNARDAMPSGGQLTIEVEPVIVDAALAAQNAGAAAGPHVKLSMKDTGVGMDEAIVARIFEPFFTTKGAGKGTGLGLSTCYGIVQQSGGLITVETAPGAGTAFHVYMPQSAKAEEVEATQTAMVADPGGHETVLLVEDEPSLRALLSKVLRTRGYTVYTAADGAEALSLALAGRVVPDLVLTDVVMPNMSGPELVERLQSSKGPPRALFMSGYAGHAELARGMIRPGYNLLEKPFSPDALARKVREILRSPPGSSVSCQRA